MNINLLIDAIVRQTVVLIAQLATASGSRAPLAHVAGQVFLDLTRELTAQGLGQKIIADMFGLALRTYHRRVRELSESTTERGRTLWEAVLGYVRQRGGVVGRVEVLERFARDDDAVVRAVLGDLVESGLIFQTGRGDSARYRAASEDELRQDDGAAAEGLSAMVLVAIHRFGPLDASGLRELVHLPADGLEAVIERLVSDGQVERVASSGGEVLRADRCVIPLAAPHGWEAAVYDHFQALVTAIGAKLRGGGTRSLPDDTVGGSTYHFDLPLGHPRSDEILGLLGEVRRRATELRERLDAEAAPGPVRRVVFYVGQSVLEMELGADDEGGA